MQSALLDTDIFSELCKARNRTLMDRAEAYRRIHGTYTICHFTVFEVVKGLHKVDREEEIQRLRSRLKKLIILPLELDAAILAGRIYADLERTGQPIGRIDPLIAGTAIHAQLTLVTGNTHHYQRIVELGYPLKIDSWRAA